MAAATTMLAFYVADVPPYFGNCTFTHHTISRILLKHMFTLFISD